MIREDYMNCEVCRKCNHFSCEMATKPEEDNGAKCMTQETKSDKPAANAKRICVPLQSGINLVAEIGADENFKEIYIGLETDKGVWVQDIAMVGEKYKIDNHLNKKHIDDKVRALIWGDVNDEDYTMSFDIDVLKEEEQ